MSKVKLSCEGQTRRFTLFSSPPEIAEVKNFVSAIHPDAEKYTLTYTDEDGDKVLIDTDDELREAFVVTKMEGNNILRLVLDLCDQKKEAPPAPKEEEPPQREQKPPRKASSSSRDQKPPPPPKKSPPSCPSFSCSPPSSPPPPPRPCEVIHPAYCDGCNKRIRGVRYQCESCFDFDFCQECKGSRPHNPAHTFHAITSHWWPFAFAFRSFLVFFAILLALPCSGNETVLLILSPVLYPLYFVARRKMSKPAFLLSFGLILASCFLSTCLWLLVAIVSVIVYRKFDKISRFVCEQRQEFRGYLRRRREEHRRRFRQMQKEQEIRRKVDEERAREVAKRAEEERKEKEEEAERERKEKEEEAERERKEKEREAERERLEALSALVGMGFSLQASNDALDVVGNNINLAVDRIVVA